MESEFPFTGRLLLRAAVRALFAWVCISPAFAETHNVQVIDFEFVPNRLLIAPGDTVVWTADSPDHTVTADDGSFDSSPLPNVVTIPSGESFSHTFTTTGVFHYYCRLHGQPQRAGAAGTNSVPDDVMMGVIRVADPGVNTPPQKPVNSAPAAGATGLSTSPLLQANAFSDADEDDIHFASQWLVKLVSTGTTAIDTGSDPENLTELRLTDLEPGTQYEWQVRYSDDRGVWSEYSNPTQFTTAAALGEGNGLKGVYFAYDPKRDIITREIATRTDAVIDFDWGLGKPHPSAPANNFFVYWEGFVVSEFSEEYTFRVKADGAVRMWVNGELIVDDPKLTTFALYRSGKVTLEAGIPATIRIHYFDTKAAASMHLRWSSLNQPFSVIPQARLYSTP